MESADKNSSPCDYSEFIKDIRKQSNKKMGLSERSKTFTIENLLKSDQVKSVITRNENSPSANHLHHQSATNEESANASSLRLAFKPEAMTYDILNRLDLTRSSHPDPQLLNWLRLQSPIPPTHYLLGGLPGN